MANAALHRLTLSLPVAAAVLLSAGALARAQTQTATQAPTSKAKAAAKAALDLNTATTQELEKLPGISAATARKIVSGRPYAKVDDLAKAGVPARTVAGIRSLVRVVAASPKASAKAASASMEKGGSKVDVNTARIAELEALPGVGVSIAKAIVDGRPWKSIEDLTKIPGLGRGPRFAMLRDRITVDGSAGSALAASKEATAKPRSAPAVLKSAGAASDAPTTKLAPGQKININTASKEELDLLPGIGQGKAQAIIDARPFKTIEAIMKVKGIKEGVFARIKDSITVK
jgi:competence protein ComEA